MGAKFDNANTQRCRAKFEKLPDVMKKEIENMVKYAETYGEADHARAEAMKEGHHVEEALQKLIDLSKNRSKASDTLSWCRKAGKKTSEAFAKLKEVDDKSAEKTEKRVNAVKGAIRNLVPW